MPQAQGHERAGIQRYVLNDFSGGLHSPGVVSRFRIADTECTCAQDVDFWPVGAVSKRNGRTCENTSTQLSGAVIQIYKWYDANLTGHVLVFTAMSADSGSAEVNEFIPSAGTESWTRVISSGDAHKWDNDQNAPISCMAALGSAFFANGQDGQALMQYGGNGMVSCSAVADAPSGAKSMAFFNGYAFLGNVEYPTGTRLGSRIYWSDPNDPLTWPKSQWLDLDRDDGEEINGMCVLGNELIVFKPSTIFAVSYIGGSFMFQSELRVNGKGCNAGNSLFPRYTYISFYGSDGFYRFDGRSVERYSDKIRDLIVAFNAEGTERIAVTALESRSQLWHLVPVNSTTPNRILVYDYDRDNWSVYRADSMSSMSGYIPTSDRVIGEITVPYQDEALSWGDLAQTDTIETIVTGSTDGYIYYNGYGTADASGSNASVAMTGIWTSRWIDFDMPDINKRVTRLTFMFDNEDTVAASAHYAHVALYKNWDSETAVATADIPLSAANAEWDIAVERRVDTSFNCRNMAVKVTTDNADEPWTLHQVIIEYIPKGRTFVV